MHYPDRQRSKKYGHAPVPQVEDKPELVGRLSRADYDVLVQRAWVVSVEASDSNGRQSITPLCSTAELARLGHDAIAMRGLEAENDLLAAVNGV